MFIRRLYLYDKTVEILVKKQYNNIFRRYLSCAFSASTFQSTNTDCFIMTKTGDDVFTSFTIINNQDGFQTLLTVLNSLDLKEKIRIDFEAIGHSTLKPKLFLEKSHYSFMEFNPVLFAMFAKSQTLRQTKTDVIDCASIAHWLMTVDYKPYPVGFYHTYSLKSLISLSNTLE